jgi:hypothetical protein
MTMDPEDVEYRKSVRNTLIVIGAAVLVIVAGFIASPFLNPPQDTFRRHVSSPTANGFLFTLEVNSTSISSNGHISISAWANSTSPSSNNVTAMSSWPVDNSRLLGGQVCVNGWPIGVGVMQGRYNADNYSQGTLMVISQAVIVCPATLSPPWFEFEPAPHSSRALVTIEGGPAFWVIQSGLVFGLGSIGSGQLPSGVYTAVAADEWGDILLTNFRVS